MNGQEFFIVGIGLAALSGIGFYRRYKLVRLARERGKTNAAPRLSFWLLVFNGMTLLFGVLIVVLSLVR